MVKWMQPLYMDSGIKEKTSHIRYKFKFKKYPGNYFYIILPEGKDMPEIIQAFHLKRPYYKTINFGVIGIASGKMAAFELIKDMVEDNYNQSKEVNIRRFYEFLAK